MISTPPPIACHRWNNRLSSLPTPDRPTGGRRVLLPPTVIARRWRSFDRVSRRARRSPSSRRAAQRIPAPRSARLSVRLFSPLSAYLMPEHPNVDVTGIRTSCCCWCCCSGGGWCRIRPTDRGETVARIRAAGRDPACREIDPAAANRVGGSREPHRALATAAAAVAPACSCSNCSDIGIWTHRDDVVIHPHRGAASAICDLPPVADIDRPWTRRSYLRPLPAWETGPISTAYSR